MQDLDGLLGFTQLLQVLLLPGLGGSQLFLQLSQVVLQTLALLLLCPQLREGNASGSAALLCSSEVCALSPAADPSSLSTPAA